MRRFVSLIFKNFVLPYANDLYGHGLNFGQKREKRTNINFSWFKKEAVFYIFSALHFDNFFIML